jgi:hypothetical protein
MNHVVKIESNIAGGVDLKLGEKTLVIGKSAGGKTTVVRALELALAGGTSDLEGREWVGDDPRLLALMPAEAGHIEAVATLADGETSRFHKIAGKNANPRGGESGAKVLALRRVRAELTGSADKARVFVMRAACGKVIEADVLGRLPAGLHEVYLALAGAQKGSAVDVLQAVAGHAGKRGRELTREATGAKAVIESMTAAGGTPTEAQVAEATTAAAQLASRLHSARYAQQSVAKRAPLLQGIQEYEAAIAHWAAELAKIPEAGPADIEMQQKWSKAQSLRTVVEMQQGTGATSCRVCGTQAEGLATYLANMITAIDAALAGFAARQEALELRTKIVAKQNELSSALAGLKERFAQLPAEAEVGVDLAGLELEATAAEEHRQKLLAAFQSAEKLQKARALGHEASEKADRFKRLAAACKTAISELVTANLELFIKRVNRYMPQGMEFGVVSGTRFRIGLVTYKPNPEDPDDPEVILHTALSGAEWVAITTAIGCVVTENAEVALLIPEERAYDPEMLARIMRGLTKAPAQIVLTSTVKYKGRLPADWTVIELND